jgi:hypothetical protein
MVDRGRRRWVREVGWFGGEEFIGADLRAVPIIIFGRSGDLGGDAEGELERWISGGERERDGGRG